MNREVDTMTDEKITETAEEQQTQKDYIQELTNRISEQILEIGELHKRNTDIYKEIGILEEKLSETEKLLSEQQAEHEKLQKKTEEILQNVHEEQEKLQKKYKKKDEQIQKLKKEVMNLNESNEQLEKKVEEHVVHERMLSERILQMENSKSWKITKPLRTFYAKVH